MPKLSVRIQVLHIGVHHVSCFDGLAGFEGLVDRFACLEILDPDTIERLTLARLDEFVFDDNARVAIDNDAKP
jgi:hypothetical protein